MEAKRTLGGSAAPASRRADEIIEALKKKHDIKPGGSKPLPARSTVGIVLEGLMVNIIVPGSPAYKEFNGERIEPKDIVKAIDGKKVTAGDIITRLRGPDIPGTKVTLTVVKGGGGEGSPSKGGAVEGSPSGGAKGKAGREIDFTLTRADMRSVMNLKDLYMTLGELNTVSRSPTADELVPLVEALEICVQSTTDWIITSQQAAQALAHDLEEALRKFAAEAVGTSEETTLQKELLERTRKELELATSAMEGLKTANKQLQEQAQSATRDSTSNMSRASQLETSTEELRKSMQAARASEEQLKQQIEVERSKGAEAARALAAAQDALHRAEMGANKNLTAAQDAIRRAESDRDSAINAATLANQQVELLSKSLKTSQGFEGKAREEARRAEVAEQAGSYLKEQLREIQEKANHADFLLQREVAKAKQLEVDAYKAKSEAETCRQDVKTVLEEQGMLRKRLRALESDQDARHGKDRQVRALRTENEHLRQAVDSLREERREGRETIAAQTTELQTLRDAVLLYEEHDKPFSTLVPQASLHTNESAVKLQRKLRAAEKEVAALERELRARTEETRAQAHAANSGGGVLRRRGTWLLNTGMDDVWESIGITSLSFMAGSIIISLPKPSDPYTDKMRDWALFASGVSFFVFLSLTIFKGLVHIFRKFFNANTDHLWEAIGLTGASFMAVSVIRSLKGSSEMDIAARDWALFAFGVLFFVLSALTIFKVTVLMLKRCYPPRQGLEYVSLPDHSPLLAAEGIPDGYAQQPRNADEDMRHSAARHSAAGSQVQSEMDALSRQTGGIGSEDWEQEQLRSLGGGFQKNGVFKTWTGSTRLSVKEIIARGPSRPASGANITGGARSVPQSARQAQGGVRLAALKGNSSYGTVDFSLV